MSQPVIQVFLVDDHPVVRTGLRALLDGFTGIHVAGEAANGQEALALIDETIDVVVLDLEMPVLDGISTTQQLTQRGGPPVLMLTTYDTQTDVLAALEAGAKGYLLKDAAPETLRQAIMDTAAGKPTVSSNVAAMLVDRVQQPHTSLSAREVELLELLATGSTNKQLAGALFISEATVKTHLVHIYQKLGVTNRTAAISTAKQQRLI